MENRIKMETLDSGIGRRFTRDQSGATAIEYALIAGGISIVIVASVAGVGDQLVTIFTAVEGMF
jgi:pilus assembly protein Flp/PilA